MHLSFRKNIVTLGFLLWIAIGSSAREDNLFIGTGALLFFFLLFVAYGRKSFEKRQILTLSLMVIFILTSTMKMGMEPNKILFFLLEFLFWFSILNSKKNISELHIIGWFSLYTISLLLWKIFLSKYDLFHRATMLVNGPIKYSMISLIPYTLLLFRERSKKHPTAIEFLILSVLLLSIFSTLSRTVAAVASIVTIFFVIRNANILQKTLTIIGFSFLWTIVNQTRLFYIGNSEEVGLLKGIFGVRYLAWEEALMLIKDDLIFGVGLTSFKQTNSFNLDYPHNLFIEVLVNTGILGLTTLLLITLMQARNFNSYNLILLITSMTSGNIFLWMKALLILPFKR